MPPKRKVAGEENIFTWTDDESLLLLNITADYKNQNISEGLDWESIQNKYADIAERMVEALQKYNEQGSSGKDYKHKPEEITKEKVATKLKAVRKKYRIAVDMGSRSGQGRVILLYFHECEAIWGGSPATTKIRSGIESSVIEESQDSSSIDMFPKSTDESDLDETAFSSGASSSGLASTTPAKGVNKRRALLDETHAKHKKQKLHKKWSMESQFLSLAKEELELKKDMIEQQKQIDEDYKKTMSTLAGAMENLSKSISDGFCSLRSILSPVHARPVPYQYHNYVQSGGSSFGQQFYDNSFMTHENNGEPESEF